MRIFSDKLSVRRCLTIATFAVAAFAILLLLPRSREVAYCQGNIVSTSPYTISTLCEHFTVGTLLCYASSGTNFYLVHYAISQEQVTASLQYDSYVQHSGIQWPLVSFNGSYMYLSESDPQFLGSVNDPGTIKRYDIAALANPIPAGQYHNSANAYGIALLRDNQKIIMQTGAADDWRDALAYFPSGQVIGVYDDKRGFSAIAEKPGGGFIALAPRRKYLDEQPAEEPPEMIDRDARTIPRSGPDLIELSPTLQYVRTIGFGNKFKGMYGMSESENVQLELANNGLWAVIGWPGLSTAKMSDEEKFHWPTHPHGKWFNGLAVIDIASGNVIRHWYPNGGGLDGKVNWFDITADGMKVVAKSGAEEWGAMGEPITNGYVYIFNLATGQVVKQDWGLEDGSDIEIVDSVNRVYCTLPSQQALVWFPMP